MGFGGPVGLDYTAVFAVARALGMAVTPHLLRRLSLLEGRALDQFSRGTGRR